MRKYLLLLIIVTTLGIIAWLVWSNRGSTLSGSDREFSFDPEVDITRIEISSPVSEAHLIKQEKWTINNTEVDQKKVNTLIRLSSQVHAAGPASIELQSTLEKKLRNGKRFTIYSGRKRIISYTVCKHNRQLYALRDRKRKPYRIEIRGFSNTDLYSLLEDKPENWQSLFILNRRSDEIREVRITNFQDPQKGFQLSVSEEGDISLYDHSGHDISGQADVDLLSEYLFFFSHIPFELQYDSLPSIDTNARFFRLELTCRNGSKDLITGYPKSVPESDYVDPVFFIGIMNNKRGVELRYNEFDPILLPAEYFLKK